MTNITEIDAQKLMDLRNRWLATSEAEMEVLKQLDAAREAVGRAHSEFQAYARGGDTQLEQVRAQEALIKQGQQVTRQYADERAMTLGYPTVQGAVIGGRYT